MQKVNIKMMVQGQAECAAEFAERIEDVCNKIMVDAEKNSSPLEAVLNIPPLVSLTSDAHGRQTATIQYLTERLIEEDLCEEAAFDGILLRQAFAEYQYEKNATKSLEDFKKDEEFLKYLLEYNKKPH